MNEQLQNTMQEAAAKLIEKAMTGIDSAKGFLQAEIPEYVYQLMLWYGVKSAILFATGAILFLTGFVLIKKMVIGMAEARKARRNGEEWTKHARYPSQISEEYESIMLGLSYWPIASVLFFLSVIFFDIDWLQIWIAPKVWLVEYASELVK